MLLEDTIRKKYENIKPVLNEQQRRLWAASEALSLGYGGVSILQKATNLSRPTIHNGIKELKKGFSDEEIHRIRHKGGGRKSTEEEFPGLLSELKQIIEPLTRGDPMQPLLWTSKSTRHIAQELKQKNFNISYKTVARILEDDLGYSLQSNRKTLSGRHDQARDDQFKYINDAIKKFQQSDQPAISVDTKKKELVGNYKNAGFEWRLHGSPREVNVHDFESGKKSKKAIPYGIYDMKWNTAWVSVGIDHDTAEFAVESIRRWWEKMGFTCYPKAKRLLIIADGGGSNSSRCRLWKYRLQQFANQTNLEITVCHLPPGTSKWNQIEHRLFCHITKNWAAQPLINYETIVNLISHTTTKDGLKVDSEIDYGTYETKKKISTEEMASLNIHYHNEDRKWNYTITPATFR